MVEVVTMAPNSIDGETFGKEEIATVLQHQVGMSRAEAKRITNYVFYSMVLALQSGKSVQMPNIGILSPHHVPERGGFHPKKGIRIRVSERIRPQFKPSKTLKRILNRDVERTRELIQKWKES